ncbi:hypothetical protein NQZ68_019780 [Dissostichus eleginoides]|nr:hypothetical protein NQZ68_019780 [Dissostichus eleginoides]
MAAGELRRKISHEPSSCQRLATPDGIVISSVLGSVAAEGAEGTTGGEANDDSSITVVQIGQNGEYLGTARLPAQTEGTCYTEPITGEAAGPRVRSFLRREKAVCSACPWLWGPSLNK